MPDRPTPLVVPPDDPLIAAWLAHLAAHPEATPQHRRFARWVRKLWRWYAAAHPRQGILYWHYRGEEPHEIRHIEEWP